jgi:hypothetical protein
MRMDAGTSVKVVLDEHPMDTATSHQRSMPAASS